MDEYLKSLQSNLKDLKNASNVTFVIGNESCDLDSAVSAIVYAYFLFTKKKTSEIICPILQVSKDDVALRTEVIFCMKKLGLSISHVPCIEEFDFVALSEKFGENQLKIILVDHNNIFDESLETKHLAEIIDHHEKCKSTFKDNVKLTIETVGSCATLIMQRIWEQNPEFEEYNSMMLCRYAIITDTVNFSEEAKKTTQQDINVMEELDKRLGSHLKKMLGIKERDKDYKLIATAKQDTQNLTVLQCLRKDLKIMRLNEADVAVASHMELGEKFILRDNFEIDVESFLNSQRWQVVIVMGLQISTENQIRRDLLIIPSNGMVGQKIIPGLTEMIELKLKEKQVNLENVKLFEQGDVSYSRKKIIPILKKLFSV